MAVEGKYPPYTVLHRPRAEYSLIKFELEPGEVVTVTHGMVFDVYNSTPGIPFPE